MYNQLYSDYKKKYISKIDNQIGGQIGASKFLLGGKIGNITILEPSKNFEAQFSNLDNILKIVYSGHQITLPIQSFKHPESDELKSITVFVTTTGSVVVIIAKPNYGHTSIGYNYPPINIGLLDEKDNHLF